MIVSITEISKLIKMQMGRITWGLVRAPTNPTKITAIELTPNTEGPRILVSDKIIQFLYLEYSV